MLSVDEDRQQTQAIHRWQREQQTIEGLLKRLERKSIIERHQNAQRLLKPLFVANPFAHELTFPDHRTRLRRDHTQYLTQIRSIALLHQHQRPLKTAQGVTYIEATREDIATADRLMGELLKRSLDELPPQTGKLLALIEEMVGDRKGFHFSRRQVREHTGWGMNATTHASGPAGGNGVRPDAPRRPWSERSFTSTLRTWRGRKGAWRGESGPKTGGMAEEVAAF